MNYFRRFQQGSEVQYKGTKFAGTLKNKLGVIDGFVSGTERGVAVTFPEMAPEDRHYVMDESRDLEPFVKRAKIEKPEDEGKQVKVEKRKGVAKGRRNNQEEG